MKITFSYEYDENNQSKENVVMSTNEETIDGLLIFFTRFLKACGFCIDNQYVDIFSNEEDEKK